VYICVQCVQISVCVCMCGVCVCGIPEARSYREPHRKGLIERVKAYLKTKQFSAETFEEYALQGTPSSILIDKKGILRNAVFGQNGYLDTMVRNLLEE